MVSKLNLPIFFKIPPINGANTTTPKDGNVINQLGEKLKSVFLIIPDKDGAIAQAIKDEKVMSEDTEKKLVKVIEKVVELNK